MQPRCAMGDRAEAFAHILEVHGRPTATAVAAADPADEAPDLFPCAVPMCCAATD